MVISITILCFAILALVHVQGLQPRPEVLSCDSDGGYWSHDEGVCQKTDSPLAGLAS